jgi:iron complex transport system substrate-binding protein
MYAAAPQSFMGELLHLLGAGNIAPADAAHFPRISPEYVRRADPDLIIQTYAASVRDLAQRPGWAQLRAVRQGQVCQLNASESRVLTRPGPRLDIAAAVLARCLRAPQGDAAALIHQWEQLP